MKITCQSCQSKYTVSDEKVQGKTVKIKCRKCGSTILVNSSGAQAGGNGVSEPESYGAGGEGGAAFTVNVADGDQRTMTMAEVVDAYNTQVITADTYVWSDGMTDWMPLGQVDAIVAALNAAAQPQGVPEAGPSFMNQMPEPEAAATPAAMPPMAAPSFGNQMPDPMPVAAAPRAAARRDGGRGSRDLFGGGLEAQQMSATEEAASSAPLFSAGVPQAQPSATGQRDENSVLFSLSALTAKAGTQPAAPSKTTATKDDSGLIDLRALAAGAGGASAAPALVPDTAALFPLGVPVAAPASVHPGSPYGSIATPPAKNRTPIFIALGSVVALAAIVGAFFVMKGGGDKPPAPVATEAPAPPPPVTAAATAEPTAAPTAEASAAPTATASGAAKAPVKVAGKAPPAAAKGDTGKPAAPAAATGAAKAPAGKGNCGCTPGDLMCAMKCSTK